MTSETKTLDTIEATTAVLQAELPRLEQHQQTLEKELAAVTERLESVRTALTALRVLSAAPVPSSNTEAEDIRAEGTKVADAPAGDITAEAEAGAKTVVAPRIPHQAQESIDTAVQAEATQEQAAAAAPARRTARKAPASKAGKQAPAKPKTTRGQAKKAVAVKDTKATKTATKAAAKPAAKPAAATKSAKAATKPAAATKTAKAKAPKKAAPAAPAVDDSGSLTELAVKVLATFGDTPVRAREVTKALGRELTPNSINTVRSTLDRLVATSRAHRAGRGLYQAPAN